MAKQRIYRQQLRANDFVQPIHIGVSKVIFAAEDGRDSKLINIWFEDDYDRQDHLPPLKNFQVLLTGSIVPAYYHYVTSVATSTGRAYHIYQEDERD